MDRRSQTILRRAGDRRGAPVWLDGITFGARSREYRPDDPSEKFEIYWHRRRYNRERA